MRSKSKTKETFAFSTLAMIAAAAILSAAMMAPHLFLQQQANAQGKQNLTQGQITAASGGKPFGGERIGSYALTELGSGVVNILIGSDKTPTTGKVFKAWLADTKTGVYVSLGQVDTDGKLSFTGNVANPRSYDQIVISEEAPTVKPSQIIGGDALSVK